MVVFCLISFSSSSVDKHVQARALCREALRFTGQFSCVISAVLKALDSPTSLRQRLKIRSPFRFLFTISRHPPPPRPSPHRPLSRLFHLSLPLSLFLCRDIAVNSYQIYYNSLNNLSSFFFFCVPKPCSNRQCSPEDEVCSLSQCCCRSPKYLSEGDSAFQSQAQIVSPVLRMRSAVFLSAATDPHSFFCSSTSSGHG